MGFNTLEGTIKSPWENRTVPKLGCHAQHEVFSLLQKTTLQLVGHKALWAATKGAHKNLLEGFYHGKCSYPISKLMILKGFIHFREPLFGDGWLVVGL